MADEPSAVNELSTVKVGNAANSLSFPFPVLGIAAWSGTGKTTLLEKLLPLLRERGLKVGVVKHAHHTFEVDHPGKDSYKLRHAGAEPMVIASRDRFALMQETPGQKEPDLAQLLAMMTPHTPDIVIVEGFKAQPISKLVLYRHGIGDATILTGPWVEAVALSQPSPVTLPVSVSLLDLDDPQMITSWIVAWMDRKKATLASS